MKPAKPGKGWAVERVGEVVGEVVEEVVEVLVLVDVVLRGERGSGCCSVWRVGEWEWEKAVRSLRSDLLGERRRAEGIVGWVWVWVLCVWLRWWWLYRILLSFTRSLNQVGCGMLF